MKTRKLFKEAGPKSRSSDSQETGPRRYRPWMVQIGVVGLGAGLLLIGIFLVNQATREDLSRHNRYLVDFTAIQCEAPPALARAEFLSEVQYLGGMPSKLPVLDQEIGERLAGAFARHPWVEKVEEIQITPSQTIKIRLTYRTPVLGVLHEGQLRAVDRYGVLLPPTSPTEGLPLYSGKVKPPRGPAGTPWGDVALEKAAAKTANRNQAH
ncbi:MAG TPA: hypothetical protein VGY77_11835 [Gemmataceae bacterium]|nr:hypothetical protein [Gemmataceae bacterium]